MVGSVCCHCSLKYLLPYSEILTLELQSCRQIFSLFLLCENWVNFVSLCSEIKKRLLLMMQCNCFTEHSSHPYSVTYFDLQIPWCHHSLLGVASIIFDYATCSCHPLVLVCIATGPSRLIQKLLN